MLNPLNGYGSYLIRESKNNLGGYVLSVRDRDQVKHYKIKESDNQEFFISEHRMFNSLQALVTHYQQQADELCVNLRNPCAFTPTDVSGKPVDADVSGKPVDADVSGKPVDEWEIDRSSITLVRKVMSGEFTEVWKGRWNNTRPVAVKTLKPKQNMTVDEFFQPVNLMKELRHPKLVELYGVCSKKEPVFIITEFMEYGNLLEYLHCGGKSLNLSLNQLMNMASQVAGGMAYLENRNYIVHRDLQTSNVLVGAGPICKLAICKLARVMHQDVYEGQEWEEIAIKWAAPEAALHNKFSIKSDVWSFGIVLCEIITHGKPPYPEMTDAEVKQKTQQGYHMPQSLGCQGKLYDIMLNCWQAEPANRPTFESLQQQLADFDNNYNNIYGKLYI